MFSHRLIRFTKPNWSNLLRILEKFMLNPFHLSFVVPEKETAKKFYTEVLGCEIGRDNPTWFDILFFGHQLTIHQSTDEMPAYLIDHFGPILSKSEWQSLSQGIQNAGIEFAAKPVEKEDSSGNASGKFLLEDPAGNTLEFKYYENFLTTVRN